MTDYSNIFELSGINAGYGAKQVLHSACLNVKPGEVVGLIGANGAGKSTLLKVVGGTLLQQEGSVSFLSQDCSQSSVHGRARSGLGFLMPKAPVFESMTVQENLLVAARSPAQSVAGRKGVGAPDLFRWFPELRDLATRRAGLLSGGERQMLALSLVLVREPVGLLLDEPTGGLDLNRSQLIMERIEQYVRETKAGAILVEHKSHLVLRFCARIYFMAQGRVVDVFDSDCPDAEERLTRLFFGPEAAQSGIDLHD